MSVVNAKILIVDDALDSWRLLNTILKAHDFHPIWAADGMQAIAAARLHQPLAILLDLCIPGRDGFLVLERLKSNRFVRHIPVIAVTARDRQEAEEQPRCLGAVDYVLKPIQGDVLMTILRIVLATQLPESGTEKTA